MTRLSGSWVLVSIQTVIIAVSSFGFLMVRVYSINCCFVLANHFLLPNLKSATR